MDDLQRLLRVDSSSVLDFFVTNLRDEVSGAEVPKDETNYIARVLSNHALATFNSTSDLPVPSTLSELLLRFHGETGDVRDFETMEVCGQHCFLLCGFYRDYTVLRRDIELYDRLGQSFYSRASRLSTKSDRQELFRRLVISFTDWAIICCNVRRRLDRNQFLFGSLPS